MDDRTDHDDYELLVAQLPHHWVSEIAKEQSKRDAREHWVKVTGLPKMPTKDFETLLYQLSGARVQDIKKNQTLTSR